LESLKSVREFSRKYKEEKLNLDVLILNAGVMRGPFTLSEDGIELQLAVNHFGHSALTFELLDIMLKSKYNPRIVILSSGALRRTHDEGVFTSLEKVNNQSLYDEGHMYGQSKLANFLFGSELQRRLDSKYPNKNFFVNIVHPGAVATELFRIPLSPILQQLKDFVFSSGIFWDAKTGSLTQVGAAVDPSIEKDNIKGQYFVPVFRVFPDGLTDFARDEKLALKFWDFTISTLKSKGINAELPESK